MGTRPAATRQSPGLVELHAEMSQRPDLQQIAHLLRELARWASNPLNELVSTHQGAQEILRQVRWLLTQPGVWAQLGPAAEELHTQIETLEIILDLVGWTPTAAMQLLEIQRAWRWAQEGI